MQGESEHVNAIKLRADTQIGPYKIVIVGANLRVRPFK